MTIMVKIIDWSQWGVNEGQYFQKCLIWFPELKGKTKKYLVEHYSFMIQTYLVFCDVSQEQKTTTLKLLMFALLFPPPLHKEETLNFATLF